MKEKVCVNCRKKFFKNTNKQKFCSLKCYREHNSGSKNCNWKDGSSRRILKNCPICEKDFIGKSKQITCSKSCGNTYFRQGKNNPRYKNGEGIYRKLCFEFHDHQCIICNEKNILDAHHIDRNKQNNVPENLVPLCPTHHRYCHSKFRKIVDEKIDKYLKRYRKDSL